MDDVDLGSKDAFQFVFNVYHEKQIGFFHLHDNVHVTVVPHIIRAAEPNKPKAIMPYFSVEDFLYAFNRVRISFLPIVPSPYHKRSSISILNSRYIQKSPSDF